MQPLAFDTETCLIRRGLLAPPLVCVTWQRRGQPAGIAHHSEAEPLIRGWLEDPNTLLIGHHIAFDMAVIAECYPPLRSLIFAVYETDRVTDTMLRGMLIDIASGTYRGRPAGHGKFIKYEYNLAALAKRYADIELSKDAWRTSYAEFLHTPLNQWPARAVEVQDHARSRLAELHARDVAKTWRERRRLPALLP